jgi:hypothetical protein
MAAIAGYHAARSSTANSLDDRTWADLDLDAVFAAVDHTTSTIGEQALYHRLRTAPAAPHPDAFEALIGRASDSGDDRERAQLALAVLQHPDGYDVWWLAQPGTIESAAWHAIFPMLALVAVSALALMFVWPGTIAVVALIAVVNLFIRAATARRIGTVLGAFRQVGPLLGAAEGLAFVSTPETIAMTGPLVQQLPGLRRLRRIARWISRDALTAGEPLTSILEYLNLMFLLDANALYFASRELRARGPALLQVVAAVGDVDAAIAVASFRASHRGWTRPRLAAPDQPMRLAQVRHPLLESPVPNSIELAPPYGVLVTGSNMSGKTTFLRTVGVSAVLAQTINTCLAASYEAPIYRVRSCIGRSDDLLSGKSYYMAEVDAVLGLVRASAQEQPHLFLFDELFRGTNAVERVAAGEAVLAELLSPRERPSRHVVIAATHDGELVDLLRERYAPYHFTDRVEGDQLVFDYLLKAGPATTRNAIALLRLNGAPESLVARALARAETLDRMRRV